jgi:hypothetical protein
MSSCENSDWMRIYSVFHTRIDFLRQPHPPQIPIFYVQPKLNGGHDDFDKKRTGCTNHIYMETIVAAFFREKCDAIWLYMMNAFILINQYKHLPTCQKC